jgi:hypothetical protein
MLPRPNESPRPDTVSANGTMNANANEACITNVRLDQMTTRLDTHEKVLVHLVDLGERHQHALARVVNRLESLDDRFDNFLIGLEAREGRSA